MFIPFGFMGGAPAVGWTPADIAKYWWTADAGVTIVPLNDVASWVDQVGGLTMTGGTGAGNPEGGPLVTQGALNNQKVIRFDGNSRWLERPPISFASDGYAFTCITVAYKDNGATTGTLIAQSLFAGAQGRFGFLTDGGTFNALGTNFTSATSPVLENPSTTGVKVAAYEYDASGNGRVWFNDFNTPTALSGGSSNVDMYQGSKLLFGAFNNSNGSSVQPSYFWDGDIAEVIFVPNVLSAGDISNLQTYINTKYNLSV